MSDRHGGGRSGRGRDGAGRQGPAGGTGRPAGKGGPAGKGRGGGKGRVGGNERSGGRAGARGAGGSTAGRGGARRRPADDASRRAAESAGRAGAEHGPEIPERITGRELDPAVSRQLRSLPDRLAARIARHLVAAGELLETDPELAYQHTLAARNRATRLAVVREACGEAAYLAGHFAEALTELRAARRMNGSADFLAVMADCERALGRPERALDLARDPAADTLRPADRIELRIVESGARRDLGDADMAVRLLERENLHSNDREPWVSRLRYAYADALLAAGRPTEASEWFHRAAAADPAGLTDAEERAAELDARSD